VDITACTDAHIVVMTTNGSAPDLIAESIIMFVFALLKKVPEKECSEEWASDAEGSRNSWRKRLALQGKSPRGMTVGFVGFDAIALEVIRMLQPFGIGKIYVYVREIETLEEGMTPTEKACVTNPFFAQALHMYGKSRIEVAALASLLPMSDIVTVHCCSTDKGCFCLIDLDMISLMKKDSILINAAHGGGVVDEDSLYVALHDSNIAGAAIDCWTIQPPEVATMERFASLENAMVSGGNISHCPELFRSMMDALWLGISDLAAGVIPSRTTVLNPEVLHTPEFKLKLHKVFSRLPHGDVHQEPSGGIRGSAAGTRDGTPRAHLGRSQSGTPKSGSPRRIGASLGGTPRKIGASLSGTPRKSTPREGAGF